MAKISEHDLIERLRQLSGPNGWLDDDQSVAPYTEETRGLWHGHCIGVARPENTAQLAKIMAFCQQSGIPVTPQSGNSGLVGGGVPKGGIVLSLNRMQKIRALDTENNTITVDAGCILSDVQNAARDAGKLFPLSLAAEGSCRIGGNLSTNAGGVQVLKYGNARDLALGLEVVLADGQIWNGLKGLRKDNTGYDMKHLFMGSEGTLGIITGAVLKLYPQPKSTITALIALSSTTQAMDLFKLLNDHLQGMLSAFEIINKNSMEMTLEFMQDVKPPFENIPSATILLEITSGDDEQSVQERLQQTLMSALENNMVEDVIVAQNHTQANTFWTIREAIPEAQKVNGGSIKHDVAVPISKVAAFMDEATRRVEAEMPGIRVIAFGHLGDGNIHFNLSQPVDMEREKFMDQWDHFSDMVHALVMSMNGSFSAEHGVGTLKIKDVVRYNDPVGIELMRTLKRALDPDNILNPGKVIPPPSEEPEPS